MLKPIILMLMFGLLTLASGLAHADNALEQWRSRAGSIRQLAENDISAAYAEAQRLQAELPADATPADRALLLNLLSRIENYLGETNISMAHAQQAFDLAKQNEDKAGQAEADISIALNSVNQGNIDGMIAADTHSLAILEGVDRPDLLAEAMLRGSMMYTRMEMPEESVSIAVQAMEIARRGNNDRVLAYAYQGMAVAYEQNARNAEARDNYAEMLKHARAAHSKILEGTALNGMGAALDALGDHQGGERSLKEAIDLYRAVGGPFYLARSLFMLAENQRQQGRFAEAVRILDEVAAIFEQRSNKIGLWWTLSKRSQIYQALGKMTQASFDAEHAYRLAKEMNFPVYLSKSARHLSVIFASRGDYREAYRLGKTADELSAKAASDNAGKRMIELAERYQAESKQREIDKLNRRNQQQATELAHRALEQRWLWTVLVGSVVVLVGTAFFLVRLRRSHRSLEVLNTQVLQAKNKLQATLDTIPDLLLELGPDGRYHDYHSPRTDLLAAPFEDPLGKTVEEVMSADAAAICMSALREAHENGVSTGKQFELSLPHGNFWFELSVAEKPAVQGEGPRFIVLSRDITERKHLEATALQREQEFRVLVENSPDLIFRYDNDCRRIYANPAVARLVGKPADALLDSTPSEAKILSAKEADKLIQMIRQVLATGQPAESVVECLDADGRLHYFHNRYAPEFNTHGKVVSVISIARDITERKQATEALAAREREFRTLAESLPDNIARYDREGRVIYINSVLEKTLGAVASDMLGTTVRERHPNGEYDDYTQLLDTVLASGEIGEIEKIVTPPYTGSHLIHSIRMIAERDENGEVIGVLAIGRDITERKRAEDEIRGLNASLEQRVHERTEELRLQTRYLRTLIDTLPMLAWFKDKESRFLVVNQAVVDSSPYNAENMIGKSDLDLWPHELAEVYRADDANVMSTGQRKTLEERLPDAHGGTFWVETFKAPVLDEDGSVLGTVGISRDITERKSLETAREAALAEAVRLARLRSEFMARMSHELRTPLNGILGYAQVMSKENQLSERHSVMLNVIQQSGKHLLDLINDILDFAKIESGKQELSLSDVPLRRFMANLAGIVSFKAEQKHLSFVCDVAADVPAGIRVDEMRLRQVLLNLLSNAVKYSDHGQITLRVTVSEPGRLHFEIQDSGIGIPEGQLEAIFQPFEQAGDKQRQTGGTGLGLPISRELVRLMGSDIHVTSRVGEGSTFGFDLETPVVDIHGDIMLTEQGIVGYQGARRRVLVVDDIDANRALLVDVFSGLNFETAEAANGQACLDSVETFAPDLIVLDIVMPEMDGLETARRLRQMPGFAQTPIIAVSAIDSDVGEVTESGANVFLSKPIDIKRLTAHIGRLLKLDWIYATPEAELSPKYRLNEWLDAPPLEEMEILHKLAQEGSMRDISDRAAYLAEFDDRYRPFAEQLRNLAKGYQSKAILDLVDRYINRHKDHGSS